MITKLLTSTINLLTRLKDKIEPQAEADIKSKRTGAGSTRSKSNNFDTSKRDENAKKQNFVSNPPEPKPFKRETVLEDITKVPQNELEENEEPKKDSVSDEHVDYISTTRMGKMIGIEAKPLLFEELNRAGYICLLYTSPSPRD